MLSPLNVSILTALVSAAQQDDHVPAAPDEVQQIPRAVTDPHLRQAVAECSYVAQMAMDLDPS